RKPRPARDPDAHVLAHLVAAALDRNAERFYLLALEDRPAVAVAIERNEEIAVVRCIELTAECDVPAADRIERRQSRADLFENPQVGRVPKLRDGQVVLAGEPGDERTRQVELGAGGARAIEILGVVDPETASHAAGAFTVGRRHDDEPDAAMDGKDTVAVVEADDRIDGRMVEQMPPERGAAAVGDGAGRQDEADAAATAGELQRALDEELVAIDVRACIDAVDARFANERGEALRRVAA